MITKEEIWSYINSVDYVNSELDFTEKEKQEIRDSRSYSVLSSLSNENKSLLKDALLALKDKLRERVQEIIEIEIANKETKNILLVQISDTTIMDSVNTVNSVLPSNILIQDLDLNNTISDLTKESLELVNEITELNYRYNQTLNIDKSLEIEKEFLKDLFNRVDSIITGLII